MLSAAAQRRRVSRYCCPARRGNLGVAFVAAVYSRSIPPVRGRAIELDRSATNAMFRVLCLLAVALLACFAAACFANPLPPGGVAWPYFVALLIIPFASYCFAGRLSVAVCYGFSCGLFFAWPVFVDSRTPLRAESGVETEFELLARIVLFATAMSVTCAISCWLAGWPGRRTSRCS